MSAKEPCLADFLKGRQSIVMNKTNSGWFYTQQRKALLKITPIDIHTAWVELTETGKEFARHEQAAG
jgi:hypothetical protein